MEFCFKSFFLQRFLLKINTHYIGIYGNKNGSDLLPKYPCIGMFRLTFWSSMYILYAMIYKMALEV
jgi:hypothetical protein